MDPTPRRSRLHCPFRALRTEAGFRGGRAFEGVWAFMTWCSAPLASTLVGGRWHRCVRLPRARDGDRQAGRLHAGPGTGHEAHAPAVPFKAARPDTFLVAPQRGSGSSIRSATNNSNAPSTSPHSPRSRSWSPTPSTTRNVQRENTTSQPSSHSPDDASTSYSPCSETAPSTKPRLRAHTESPPTRQLDQEDRGTFPGLVTPRLPVPPCGLGGGQVMHGPGAASEHAVAQAPDRTAPGNPLGRSPGLWAHGRPTRPRGWWDNFRDLEDPKQGGSNVRDQGNRRDSAPS